MGEVFFIFSFLIPVLYTNWFSHTFHLTNNIDYFKLISFLKDDNEVWFVYFHKWLKIMFEYYLRTSKNNPYRRFSPPWLVAVFFIHKLNRECFIFGHWWGCYNPISKHVSLVINTLMVCRIYSCLNYLSDIIPDNMVIDGQLLVCFAKLISIPQIRLLLVSP